MVFRLARGNRALEKRDGATPNRNACQSAGQRLASYSQRLGSAGETLFLDHVGESLKGA